MTAPPAPIEPPAIPDPPWNTDQTTQALIDRYAYVGMGYTAPRYALFHQVADATGSARRYADAIGMQLWKSDGYELHGYEVKSSRADWLGELKDPTKAEAFKRYMDRWYLVVGDASIVRAGELPPGWGLLAPRGRALVATVPAPKLVPEPMPRAFLAAVLRRATEQSVDATRLEHAEQRGRVDGWNLARATIDHVEGASRMLRRIRDEHRLMADRITTCLRGASKDE